MKRSRVNKIMREANEFIRSFGYVLPPFAYTSPSDMQSGSAQISRIVRARMGWDITDYGQGRFDDLGLFLFTVRNGIESELPQGGGGMCYAEKIMISRKDQISPMHRHIVKAEDIINRGGATLALKLHNSDADGNIDLISDVEVVTDGRLRRQKSGDVLRLGVGESVTLMPGNWHEFWGEGGDVLIGEVSSVNNDETDNVFAEQIGRFSEIEEDEEPWHLLVSDYSRWLG